MELPQDVFSYIFTFIPFPYKDKIPPHVIAINSSELFADFTIDNLLFNSDDFDNIYDWKDSFIKYKYLRKNGNLIVA